MGKTRPAGVTTDGIYQPELGNPQEKYLTQLPCIALLVMILAIKTVQKFQSVVDLKCYFYFYFYFLVGLGRRKYAIRLNGHASVLKIRVIIVVTFLLHHAWRASKSRHRSAK